jgi:hypothetical protein
MMTVRTPSKTTKTAAKGATKAAGNRPARRAAKAAAKATWFVGKTAAKRKARTHARRYRDTLRTAQAVALIYGPMAAEVLGLVPPPKPRRRVPAFLAGVAVGAGLMYFAPARRDNSPRDASV